MKTEKKKLPIGIESFEKLQTEEFYYIDKTGFIKELLTYQVEVTLFTRPRRFGKSLNMSMLKCFFELGIDKELFSKLKVSEETELCEEYMGKFPVIFVSLKGMNAGNYAKALEMAVEMIRSKARRFQYLLDSECLTAYDKEAFIALLQEDMKEGTLCSSLKVLSELLEKHHGCKVILFINEYDVPLTKVFRIF